MSYRYCGTDIIMINDTLIIDIIGNINFLFHFLTVVWNPWKEKAKAMGDFGDDEVHKISKYSV